MLSQLDLCDVHDLSIKMHALDGTGEPLHSIPDLGTNIGGTKYGISPLTSASMYAIFASEGKYCTPRPIEKITKTNGETMKEYQNQCEQVLGSGHRERCQLGSEGRYPARRFRFSARYWSAERFGCEDRYER